MKQKGRVGRTVTVQTPWPCFEVEQSEPGIKSKIKIKGVGQECPTHSDPTWFSV